HRRARGAGAMTSVPLAAVDGALAGHAPLPRDNGELVFEEPWQARALGMGVVVLERTGTSWGAFRRHLVAAIRRRGGEAPGEAAAGAEWAARPVPETDAPGRGREEACGADQRVDPGGGRPHAPGPHVAAGPRAG